MKTRLVAAALILTGWTAACSAGSTPPAAPTPGDGGGLPTRAVVDARDVADQLEDRQADLEAQLP